VLSKSSRRQHPKWPSGVFSRYGTHMTWVPIQVLRNVHLRGADGMDDGKNRMTIVNNNNNNNNNNNK